MNESNSTFEHDTEVARGRRESFLSAVPKELLDREDRLASSLQEIKAAPRSKLRRVYVLMDEISKAREAFVACGKGCADCCRMNISVTKLEASQLSRATGRKAVDLTQSKSHSVNEFFGRPCPFLVKDQCSVYEDRPLACRKHASYYTSNWACKTDNLEIQGVPMVQFTGLDEALFMVSADDGQPVVADIRDFFPPADTGKGK